MIDINRSVELIKTLPYITVSRQHIADSVGIAIADARAYHGDRYTEVDSHYETALIRPEHLNNNDFLFRVNDNGVCEAPFLRTKRNHWLILFGFRVFPNSPVRINAHFPLLRSYQVTADGYSYSIMDATAFYSNRNPYFLPVSPHIPIIIRPERTVSIRLTVQYPPLTPEEMMQRRNRRYEWDAHRNREALIDFNLIGLTLAPEERLRQDTYDYEEERITEPEPQPVISDSGGEETENNESLTEKRTKSMLESLP